MVSGSLFFCGSEDALEEKENAKCVDFFSITKKNFIRLAWKQISFDGLPREEKRVKRGKKRERGRKK
jgi:hypothetical protein